MTIRLQLITALQDAADTLEAAGVDVSPAWKRRDKREPERREKEAAEDALSLWLRRHFTRQAKRIRAKLELQPPAKKALPPGFEDEFELDDEEMAQLIRLLTKHAQGGIALFGSTVPLPINYALTNAQAAEWARKYAYKLVKDIDDTTVEVLRQAITAFVETPGFTIGDIMNLLPFDEERALRVAVTEVTRAYAQGQVIAGEQMRDEFPDVQVKKRWFTNNDDLVCPLCGPLDGVEVDLTDNFYDPGEDEYLDGNPPYHPNCLPGNALVLPIGRVAGGSKRWYQGDVIIIETLVNKLTVTPNHPVLTLGGWVAAGELIQGGDVIRYTPRQNTATGTGYEQQGIASIEDVFSSLSLGDFRVPVTPPDFHGDGANSDVAIIRANGKVDDGDIADFFEPSAEQSFIGGNVISYVPLPRFSAPDFTFEVNLNPPDRVVGGRDLADTLLGIHAAPFDGFGLGLIAGSDTGLQKMTADSPAIDTVTLSDTVLALAGNVTVEKIVKIGKIYFSGHVYNLQTDTGLFVADGIITHNCRCWVETYTALAEL